MIEKFEKGWDQLEELLEGVLKECPFAVVVSKQRRFGMFHVKFAPVESTAQQFLLDSISYMLERKSVWICEKCSGKGASRKRLNPRQILCLPCYALTVSYLDENPPKDPTMFYTQEDLDELTPIVADVFGPQAAWRNTTPDLMSLVVISQKYGKLWYGDVPSVDWLADRCSALKSNSKFDHDTLTVTKTNDDRVLFTF